MAIISLSCKNQTKKDKSKTDFSKKDKDSITSIINKLYGDWASTNKDVLNLNKQGFHNCYMTISKSLVFQDINNGTIEETKDIFDNSIWIEEIILTSVTPVNSPEPDFVYANTLIKKFYLEDSFDVYITKKNGVFGFLYQDDEKNSFIPIKFLNHNLLRLVDGREFMRIR